MDVKARSGPTDEREYVERDRKMKRGMRSDGKGRMAQWGKG